MTTNKRVRLDFKDKELNITRKYYINKFDIIDLNNDEVVGYIRYSVNEADKALFIHNIEMYKKREGYGTATINVLRDKYKNYWAIGDILYPLAWEFWRTFATQLNKCTGKEPDLWFEFKL